LDMFPWESRKKTVRLTIRRGGVNPYGQPDRKNADFYDSPYFDLNCQKN